MSERMVLLINFGGPRSETEIPPFLENLIGREPAPALVEGVLKRYAAIGGSSPLPAVTEDLAHLLASCVDADTDVSVKAVFMYGHPTIEEGIKECGLSGVTDVKK